MTLAGTEEMYRFWAVLEAVQEITKTFVSPILGAPDLSFMRLGAV